MRGYIFLGVVLCSASIAVACSSSSSGGGTTPTDASQQKDASTNDGSTGNTNDGSTGNTDDGSTGNTDDGSTGNTGPTLTIDDYISWCNITVNGGAVNTMGTQTYQIEAGTTVMLHGDTANAGAFYWGYWSEGDDAGVLTNTDAGLQTNKDISFTMNGDVHLHACCPDNGMPLSQCTF
jgi:hypothetical protein